MQLTKKKKYNFEVLKIWYAELQSFLKSMKHPYPIQIQILAVFAIPLQLHATTNDERWFSHLISHVYGFQTLHELVSHCLYPIKNWQVSKREKLTEFQKWKTTISNFLYSYQTIYIFFLIKWWHGKKILTLHEYGFYYYRNSWEIIYTNNYAKKYSLYVFRFLAKM